tara:strand:+ start:1496 stop:2779 length:1284 start_codon:yes stop_codon:yes gene_type:complete
MKQNEISEIPIQGVRLNLGAGKTQIEGWTPVDRSLGTDVFPLDEYEDNSIEEMRASHILEHFPFSDLMGEPSAMNVLTKWVDKLKVGGMIRISVPDFDRISELRTKDPKWSRYLMGGQIDSNDIHKSIWTETSLEALMEQCGLTRIERWISDNTDTASHPCSINLQGLKDRETPKENKTKDLKIEICAMMSVPRYGANTAWGCIVDALIPFRIPIRRATGAYWGQCLQNMMQQAVDDGLDWILTMDYDSCFTKSHIDKMLGHFGNHPEIDALAAIQAKRGDQAALATLEGQNRLEIGDKPVKVTTAHFGLTLIRVESLKKIPLPWFLAIPNQSGSYDKGKDEDNLISEMSPLRKWANIPDDNPGRLDQDIWFWHQWKHYGNSIYLAPDVRIGHIEETVLVFDDNLDTEIIYIDEWRKREGLAQETKR